MNFFLKSVGVCLCLYLCLLPVAIVTVTVRPQKSARICRVTMTLQSKLPPHPEPEPHSIQQRSMNHILATSSLSFRVLSSSLALVASWPVKADNLDTTSSNSLLSPKAYQTRTGLRYIDNVEGTGVSPQYGQLVAFNYEIFYRPPGPAKPERVDWTKTPFLHKHGNGRICRGLDEALHTMRVGGRRRAILTPAIGLNYTKLYYIIALLTLHLVDIIPYAFLFSSISLLRKLTVRLHWVWSRSLTHGSTAAKEARSGSRRCGQTRGWSSVRCWIGARKRWWKRSRWFERHLISTNQIPLTDLFIYYLYNPSPRLPGYYGDTAVSQEDVRRLAQQIQQKNIVFAPPT